MLCVLWQLEPQSQNSCCSMYVLVKKIDVSDTINKVPMHGLLVSVLGSKGCWSPLVSCWREGNPLLSQILTSEYVSLWWKLHKSCYDYHRLEIHGRTFKTRMILHRVPKFCGFWNVCPPLIFGTMDDECNGRRCAKGMDGILLVDRLLGTKARGACEPLEAP